MKIIKEEFDSSILGEDVYTMTLEDKTTVLAIEEAVKKVHKGIIFCFSPVILGIVNVLEKQGFNFVSIRNTYKLAGAIVVSESLPEGYSVTQFALSDTIRESDVFNLAHNIYTFSRYFKDVLIPKDKSRAIYIQWVNNSLYKKYAQRCYLAWHRNKPIGICTVKIRGNEGYIDLLGVLPGHQDKKIGKQLLAKSLDYLQSCKLGNIFVVTEGENIRANIFYQKNHFLLHRIELVYHKHI